MSERASDLNPEERELFREEGESLDAIRARHADCPRLPVLMAWDSGVLPEETAGSVAKHVEKCGFCQILLKDVAREEFANATEEEAQRVRKRVLEVAGGRSKEAEAGGGFFAMWFWKAVPITVLAAAAIAFVVWTRLNRTTERVPGTPNVVRQQAPPPAPSTSVLVWEKLPIKLQAGTIVIVRGAPRTQQEKYATALTSALALYKDDKYPEAAKELAKVTGEFPHGVEGQLYLGIAQVKLGQNTEAIASLNAAQKMGPQQLRDDATWYLALAYRGTGDTQSATGELQRLCEGKDSYTERACSGIQELGEKPVEKH